MPLWKPYDAKLSSKIADMNNVTTDGFAGSITAALFLQRFVEKAGALGAFRHFCLEPEPTGRTARSAARRRASGRWKAAVETLRRWIDLIAQRVPAGFGSNETEPKQISANVSVMSILLRPIQALRLWQQVNLSEVRGDAPDLTMRQAAILLTVYLDPPPHTVRGLAARLGVTKPVITRALDTMGALKLRVAPPRRERQAQRACEAHRRGCIVRRALGRRHHRQGAGADRFDRARSSVCMPFGPTLPTTRLRGEVDAAALRQRPRRRALPSPVADIRKAPRPDAGLSTQRCCGDDVMRLRRRRRLGVDPGRARRLCRLCRRAALARAAIGRRHMSSRCRARSSIPVPI